MHAVLEYDQQAEQAFTSLKLTPREAEVLFWISHGKTNHEIGVILGAKTGTICKHVEHILGKLNVENRTCAAMVAVEACNSVASASESKSVQPWTAGSGIIGTVVQGFCSDTSEICHSPSFLVA